jgi:lipoate-protein ligase A
VNTLHFIRLPNWPIFQQLQLEEALLRADERNWCVINEGSPPAIVMGISGKPELHLNASLLHQKPVPVIRRFSGGGTVFVDENTFFVTLICAEKALNIPPCPEKVFQWSYHLYHPLFKEIDFRLRENDYVISDKKFGGNAQYMRKNRWLHHSSLLWDYNPGHMEYLLMPPKTPKYREQRLHDDFLCRLCHFFPSKQQFEKQLTERLNHLFVLQETSLEVVQEILEQPHRKTTTFL